MLSCKNDRTWLTLNLQGHRQHVLLCSKALFCTYASSSSVASCSVDTVQQLVTIYKTLVVLRNLLNCSRPVGQRRHMRRDADAWMSPQLAVC